MKQPKITFALVDIKQGRVALSKIVAGHTRKIPITLKGFITDQGSSDDGTSIEFEIDVRKSKLGEPEPHTCDCVRCRAQGRGQVAQKA